MTTIRSVFKAILLTAGVWAASQVQSQVVLRPEVAKPLQAAQELMKSGNPSGAVVQAKSAMSVADLTAQERALIEQIVATASIHAKDYKTAIESLGNLSSDATLPTKERLAYQEALIGLLRAQGDVAGLTKVARVYLDQGGSKEGVRGLYLQTLSVQNRHQDVIDYLAPMLDAERSASLSEADLKPLAIAQKSIKNEAGYYEALKRLVAVAPAYPDYWRELLVQLQKQPFFNLRYELDVARLMAHRQLLKDPSEYLDQAQLALKFGYPVEARRALDAGVEAKAFRSEQDQANQQKLRDLVNRKATEDDKQIRVLEKSTKAQDQAELAEILFSKADYKAAMAAYRSALQTPNHRREAELRLHLLIALNQSAMKTEARQQLDGIKADATARELGQLWMLAN